MIEPLKEKYSIVPIYSAAAVWLIYALTVRFGNAADYILCTFIASFSFFVSHLVFPPVEIQPEQILNDAETEDASQEAWSNLKHLVNGQYAALKETPISPFLNTIKESIDQIGKAIENEPERTKIPYIKRFSALYIQYSYDLKDYESCCSILDPGRNVRELLHSIEEKWKRIADVSVALQDLVYSDRSLSIKADSEVIGRIFAPIENQQLTIMEGGQTDEGIYN